MASIVYIITSDLSAATLLRGQLRYMREHGHQVTVVCSDGPRVGIVREREGVDVVPIAFEREIDPRVDVRTLAQLLVVLRRLRPDVVNASTSKAGLLGMMAAAALRIPKRIYTVRGLRYQTTRGAKRSVLTMAERVAAAAAHRVVAVSPSLGARLIADGLCSARKIGVLGSGSSNGVDSTRFVIDEKRRAQIAQLRQDFGLAVGTPVIGFVGRFVRDKGFSELAQAFALVRTRVPNARLLLVGDYEDGDPVDADVKRRLREDPAVSFAGFVADVAPYYALMSVLAFPSYREGFPNAPLEAACFSIPTVAFDATGSVDAVVDGVTGTIVPMHDAPRLADALSRYLLDGEYQRAHGSAALKRALEDFSQTRVWDALLGLYAD